MKEVLNRQFFGILFSFLMVFSMIGSALCSAADNYPNKPIQTIVPFSPGSGADVAQRIFNKYAEPIVGKQLIVVNKPGAGGATGWAELVRAKPDGYSLAIITPPFNLIPPLVRPQQTGYTLDQFTNICIYAVVPDILYVKEGGPFNTLKDLVDYGKKNPKKLKAANAGALGADFMFMLLVEHATGIEFTQVPFKGGAESLQATLAGTTEVMVASMAFVASQKGKLRPLAIASAERNPTFPDIPTLKEQGYDVVSERFRALAGPPGLPKNIVDYWGKVASQVVANKDFQEEMDKTGQPAAFRGPKEANQSINRMTSEMKMLVEKYDLAK